MTSLRGLGWPGDTGLRVPVQALDGDSASRRFGNGAAARGVGNGAAANGADGGTSGPVGGAPDAVRRAGSLGWPPAGSAGIAAGSVQPGRAIVPGPGGLSGPGGQSGPGSSSEPESIAGHDGLGDHGSINGPDSVIR